MYTLIVVEDEYDIRRALIELIDWESLGFRVIGECENGKEAIELVQLLNPDVVITDIKMPFVSGIEFSKTIRESNPTTKIIFLTGFDDFEYTQNAIKLGIFEYLLKPIHKTELIKTMTNVKERLDFEIKKIQDIGLIKNTYFQNIAITRFSFLVSLINNSQAMKHIASYIEKYNINLKGDSNLIFTMKVNKKSIANSNLDTDDIELVLTSISSMTKTIIEKYLALEIFIYDEHIVAIISDTKENIEENSYILINEIQQTISKYYNISLAIGVSEVFSDLKKIAESYNAANSALNYNTVSDENKIIYISDFEVENTLLFLYDTQKEVRLEKIVKTGDIENLDKFVNEIFDEMIQKKASFTNCQICVLEMFATLLKSVKIVAPNINVDISNNLKFISDRYIKGSLDEIKLWFLDVSRKMINSVGASRKDSSYLLANEGLNYIKANYSDFNLSLKTVSASLFISPSYFSSIFKKEIGEAFSNSLIRIRMENAYNLILSTNMKIFEISKQTGYVDQHYFSYCFKKFYGESPNEMRTKHKDLIKNEKN